MRECFVQLQSDYEQMALNRIDCLEPGLTADEVVGKYREIVANNKSLRKSTVKIIEETLFPMLKNIETLSYEDEAELFRIAQKLASLETRHDPALALKIYQALLDWARSKKDDSKILRYLYWCGITLFYFFNKQNERSISFFSEGASYADRYDSFEDPETRQYIHRCMGNESMLHYLIGDPDERMINATASEERNFSFWNSIIMSGKDQDFPWLNYFLTGYTHRHNALTKVIHTDPESESKANIKMILDNAITVNTLYHTNRDLFNIHGGTRYDFILWEAQFFSGLISFDHLYQNILSKQAELAPDDVSSDARFVKLQLSTYLIFYTAKLQQLSDRKNEIIATVLKEAMKQLSLMPKTVNPMVLSRELQNFASNICDVFEPNQQLEFALGMTTYRHIPTYTHSIIVGKIAAALTRYLISKTPESFIGCKGAANAEDVRNRTEELCLFAEQSGLCHDIGKISFVYNPYMQARLLTEEEREIIHMHPDEGVTLMKREDNNPENNGFIDVIKGHHKFYDDTDGYPADFNTGESEYKMIVHIITVADSIDAATDDIGTAYHEKKSLEDVVAEIKTESGRRYSPAVAEALDDEKLFAEIRRILDIERPAAFYTAYKYAWDLREKV